MYELGASTYNPLEDDDDADSLMTDEPSYVWSPSIDMVICFFIECCCSGIVINALTVTQDSDLTAIFLSTLLKVNTKFIR